MEKLVDISIFLQQYLLRQINCCKMEEFLHFFLNDSIEKIQENGTYLSVAGENMLSNQIMQHKQAVLNGYTNAKQYASNDIDFWDKILKKSKENFRDILKELE